MPFHFRITERSALSQLPLNSAALLLLCSVLSLLPIPAKAQQPSPNEQTQQQSANAQSPAATKEPQKQVRVSWLYGAYVPKEAPLRPLTGKERFQLFLAQSFVSPGIYIKTIAFSAGDQIANNPSEWGRNWGGYGKRVGSRYSQFVIQNGMSAAGNAALGYEPRYDRCKCEGKWPRVRHAIIRNFLTYDRSEQHWRPQLALYGAAFGAGAVAQTWRPDDRSPVRAGVGGIISQAAYGVIPNLMAEFGVEIGNLLKKKKKSQTSQTP